MTEAVLIPAASASAFAYPASSHKGNSCGRILWQWRMIIVNIRIQL